MFEPKPAPRTELHPAHPAWPAGFRDLPQPPAAVTVAGRLDAVTTEPKVAIVGARRATGTGLEFARRLARDLAAQGVVIVSGLARGIDSAAHAGALDAGGLTVAVLGTGLDRVYPPGSGELHRRIGERGALMSEFEPDALPRRSHFPQRNRLIAAMSRAVVVVEGGERSGSRITADFGLELGREVLAVPRDPLADGADMPNRLLKEGATPVTGAGDVWPVLAWPSAPPGESGTERARRLARSRVPSSLLGLYDSLGTVPMGVDELSRRTGSSLAAIQRDLLELEIGGHVAREAGGYRRRNG